ncbi:uncharacterized protein LOC128549713 [Mercenaria mercenaria]|uniref:uncharacterized protein LOC128549713 n=1 Tax=Mercenaria mercenaria TaxID=6596 RepID=UPI00234EC5C1|nr:uncharacterized protein LOC128549713 [Mercenaria mercenaria]
MALNYTEQLNITTDKAIVSIKDGQIFDDVEKAAWKIYILPFILTFLYAMLGFIGNSTVIYIYWKRWKKNRTRVFILTLGVLDWLNCVFNMPFEIAVLWHPISFDMHYLCKISRGCTYFLNNTGSLVRVSIAIERFIVVYYPLKSRQLTPTFAKGMCLLAFIVSLIFSWPSFVFYGSHTITIPVANSVNVIGKTCLIADEHEIRTGLLLMFTTVLFSLFVLTFVVLIVLYIAIGRTIYIASCSDITSDVEEDITGLFSTCKSIVSAITGVRRPKDMEKNSVSKHTQSLNGNKRMLNFFKTQNNPLLCVNETAEVEESTVITDTNEKLSSLQYKRNSRKFSTVKRKATRKNTVMMMMVTIAFMLSYTPFLCILIIRYSNPKYYFGLSNPGKIAYHVFLRTYFINSMINPFIYGFMNLHFRKMVKQLFSKVFCSECCGRDSGFAV